jgi:lipopolysaccharide/colanic/teichoic acid biosynthesis glycosyltransferase
VIVRRSTSTTLSPIAEAAAQAEARAILNAEEFRRMIALERKRSERSRKPFMLLLLDMGERLSSEKNGKILERILGALGLSTRETDFTGWYAEGCVIGVVFTEIGDGGNSSVPGTIITRVTDTLRSSLMWEQFSQLNISFHVFPEDWDADDDQRPSNPKLYPDLSQRDESRKIFRAMKRMMDIFLSSLALILLAPAFLIIAATIKLTSDGPILFRQRRIGEHGKSFVFLKFRSMFVNNDAAVHKQYVQQLIAGKAAQHAGENGNGVYKLTKDKRITRVGGFLRKTSLDEIPQFYNVLIGEMSLVGPRPPVPYEVEAYDIWHRRRLLEAKPGITGLWQVCGRSTIKFDDMVRLDLQYARTWSPWMDLKILARTPGAVVLGEGAH